MLALLQHELDVGAHRTEDLVDLVVLVGLHHDAGLALHLVARYCHVGDDRQVGEARKVLMALYLEAEEADEEEHHDRDEEGGNECTAKHYNLLRADLSIVERSVDQLTLVGSGSQGDAVLLAFLQQHQVEPRLHVLLAANLIEHTLGDRRTADLALEHRVL